MQGLFKSEGLIGGLMKIFSWIKWQFYRAMGYGNCWLCRSFERLSWYKEKFTDKVNRREVEWSGWLCSACWHNRMDGWKETMESFRRDFDRTMKDVP